MRGSNKKRGEEGEEEEKRTNPLQKVTQLQSIISNNDSPSESTAGFLGDMVFKGLVAWKLSVRPEPRAGILHVALLAPRGCASSHSGAMWTLQSQDRCQFLLLLP